MKRLILLRHAKAVTGGPHIDDRSRELSARGRRDAPGIGRYMVERDLGVELVLSSPSKRTTETAKMVFAEFEKKPRTEFVEALYLAQAEAILGVLRGTSRKQDSICIVGHNPGLEVFAGVVAREPVWKQERGYYDALEEKFPTCALVVLDFEMDDWRAIHPGRGVLVDFMRPKDL